MVLDYFLVNIFSYQGLEYGRYLQQVVEALEQDKDFAKKLENVSQEDIKVVKGKYSETFIK